MAHCLVSYRHVVAGHSGIRSRHHIDIRRLHGAKRYTQCALGAVGKVGYCL